MLSKGIWNVIRSGSQSWETFSFIILSWGIVIIHLIWVSIQQHLSAYIGKKLRSLFIIWTKARGIRRSREGILLLESCTNEMLFHESLHNIWWLINNNLGWSLNLNLEHLVKKTLTMAKSLVRLIYIHFMQLYFSSTQLIITYD